MKLRTHSRSTAGVTLIDSLIVVAVLLFLVALLLPTIAKRHIRSAHVSCVNNLKQIALGHLIWAGDNGDRFAAQVPAAEGGSMEATLAGDVLATYRCMSNELSTPKVLLCPNDPEKSYATNFSTLTTANVSYFVGIDASETNVLSLISGDRNITNGTRLVRSLLNLSTNQSSGWTDRIHFRQGNIGLADGSVQSVASAGLQAAVLATGLASNRIVLP